MLVVGAAAVLLLSAPALGAGVLTTEQIVISGAGGQQSPAIAVDPDSPLRAAVVAEDGSAPPPFPRTAVASTGDWSGAAWPPGALTHSGSTSAGQSDIAWGTDVPGAPGTQSVYLVEEDASAGSLCTMNNSGVFFSSSDDGGATWGVARAITSGSTFTEAVEPTIAVDRASGRIYVAYTRLDFSTTSCAGAPDSSQIFTLYSDNGGDNWSVLRRVSPLATSGAAHYRSPSLTALPDGRVIVAFRDDANAQIETETCSLFPIPPATNYCGGPTAGLVGASTVVGDATSPASVSGVTGPPKPSVVAAGGRVTVAWHASDAGAVRAFAAMSTDGGATFGPRQLIDPAGAGNQLAPQLAATTGGRIDVAYLWDVANSGIVSATTASAAPPLAGATTEAWGNPVVVQTAGATGPLGRRLGVATSAAMLSPLPATVVAFTDTALSGNQDIHVAGVLHGTTAPVIAPQVVTASKNIRTIVHVDATDADGDPLTWSTGAQPTNPDSSVTTADPARGEFAFKAANVVGADTFEAVATDGVAGHEVRAMISVNVVNDRPDITCSALIAHEDTPLPIQVSDCVKDPNDDPVTMDLSNPTNGSVERIAGVWYFVPKPHSTATGSFQLHAADDGGLTRDATVTVTVAGTLGVVNLIVPDAGKTRVIASGMALRLVGHAVDPLGKPHTVFWKFGDGTAQIQGTAVAHRFRKPGKFIVEASASNAASKKLTVVVRRRAVELVGVPQVAGGVMQLTVRTRAAGKLLFRADSRSQTLKVTAGSTVQTLRIQVTTGPLVRLTLRLTASKKAAAKTLRVFRVQRLVLASPLSGD
ncbi:MAG TPA: PKD domain-containing protein [Gaiellales bacterium]|jgi:hypothetical protein|nr:PKD domain-containing protein [Gaiellales bacterium]